MPEITVPDRQIAVARLMLWHPGAGYHHGGCSGAFSKPPSQQEQPDDDALSVKRRKTEHRAASSACTCVICAVETFVGRQVDLVAPYDQQQQSAHELSARLDCNLPCPGTRGANRRFSEQNDSNRKQTGAPDNRPQVPRGPRSVVDLDYPEQEQGDTGQPARPEVASEIHPAHMLSSLERSNRCWRAVL